MGNVFAYARFGDRPASPSNPHHQFITKRGGVEYVLHSTLLTRTTIQVPYLTLPDYVRTIEYHIIGTYVLVKLYRLNFGEIFLMILNFEFFFGFGFFITSEKKYLSTESAGTCADCRTMINK